MEDRARSEKRWSYYQTLEVLRTMAAEDLHVESDAETLGELLEDVHAAGAETALRALQLMSQVIDPANWHVVDLSDVLGRHQGAAGGTPGGPKAPPE